MCNLICETRKAYKLHNLLTHRYVCTFTNMELYSNPLFSTIIFSLNNVSSHLFTQYVQIFPQEEVKAPETDEILNNTFEDHFQAKIMSVLEFELQSVIVNQEHPIFCG